MKLPAYFRHAFLAACLCAFALPGVARSADDDMPEGGKQLPAALKDIINHGADLYNSGDRNGCYRLFEGTLLALKAQLANRPDVQKVIEAGLADAASQPSVGH